MNAHRLAIAADDNAADQHIVRAVEHHKAAVVDVGASRKPQLGKQFWQAIDIFEGINQLCLLLIA